MKVSNAMTTQKKKKKIKICPTYLQGFLYTITKLTEFYSKENLKKSKKF